ncbi:MULTISPECIES: sugar ABC transporter ATP-binding protein [unclassified Oceanobacillus]|uniref:sugar ABC transporter ATP-binding protein n=1 Tax=unclassified Oceanobacillus TaxID=2630292 RepID=UPI00300E5125
MKEISKNFGGVKALKKVNLTVYPGEVHCLAGENGCGKSTLIKVLSGVNIPDHGEIYINQKRYSKLNTKESLLEGIQVIYQDFSIFPNLTVKENLALGYEIASNKKIVNWKRFDEIAKQALETINVEIDINERVENLSIADKQIIAIARSLLFNAKLIVMDEPTTALTSKEVQSLFNVIMKLKSKGISVLFVSHKLEEIFEIAERVTILRNGENVTEQLVKDLNKNKMVYHMTGREIKETTYESDFSEDREPLLKLCDLGLKYMFAGINLEIYPGDILGITGTLGSGRTELAESIFGITPSDSGTIKVHGETVTIKNPRQAIKRKIVYVPEDRLTKGLFLEQSIERNIIISTVENLLKRLKIIDDKKVKNAVKQWIENLGIVAKYPKRNVEVLSGGNQQKVVLSKWLASNPEILMLNSPTVGVDIGSKEEIHEVIKEQARNGMGVIIISDDIPELKQNCNKIITMDKGRIISIENTKEFSMSI